MQLVRAVYHDVRTRVPDCCILTVLAATLVVGLAGNVCAQSFSPFATFDNMSLTELQTLQIKLTYVGPQSKALPSLVISETSNAGDIGVFLPFQRAGINYSNDTIPPRTAKAAATQLMATIDNVGTLSSVTAGGVANNPFLSFGMHNTSQGGVSFEAVLDSNDTKALFDKLRAALASNEAVLLELSIMACPLDAVEAGQPIDVTANVSSKLSGLRLKRDVNVFVGTVTVTNNLATDIVGPISVVFKPPTTVHVADVDGYTCKSAPAGRRFVNLPLTGGTLAAGQSAEAIVQFSNPDLEQINVTMQVLAGPGAR